MLPRSSIVRRPAALATARLLAFVALAGLAACAGGVPPLARGNALLKQNKAQAAIAAFQEGIAAEPNNGRLFLGLGRAHLALEQEEEAEKAFARAAGLGEKPRAHLWLARMRREHNRYDEAVALLRDALSVAADDWALHYELGMVQLAAGDNTNAVESFQTTIGLSPNVGAAYVHLVEALANLDRHAEAASILEDALADVPSLPYALITAKLGVMYEALGRQAEADRAYKRALAKDPNTVEAIAGRARSLWREQDHVNAIDILRKALLRLPEAALLHLELGLKLDEFRVPDQATVALLEAVRLDRRLDRAYKPLLRLLDGDQSRKHVVLGILAKAAKLFPDDLDVQLRFARASFEEKKDSVVIAAASRIIELKPSHVEGNLLLGQAQARSGMRDAALETYEALLILDPAAAETLKEQIGDPEEEEEEEEAEVADAAGGEEQGAAKGGKKAKKKKKKKGKSKKKRKRRKR